MSRAATLSRWVALVLALPAAPAAGQVGSDGDRDATEAVRLVQTGYYPLAPKRAAVLGERSRDFVVVDEVTGDTAFRGTLDPPVGAAEGTRMVRIADFTPLRRPGRYTLRIAGAPPSVVFEIRDGVHAELARRALKAFYYQRASLDLEPEFAGAWSRAAGHPDTAVQVHASAASAARPAGTLISAPGGWYDAGDYNKYVVNSGITMGTLLALYEEFPEAVDDGLGIPESGNGVPDLVDEIAWNLKWMLAMQDPADGGVYHKLTTAEFESMDVMPAAATATRYVVQKSTAAALALAAVGAQSARVFSRFEEAYPGLADSALGAARAAWEWAERNPEVFYRQEAMNRLHAPPIRTGEYGDDSLHDERLWAAAELFRTTGAAAFADVLKRLDGTVPVTVPGWRHVAFLGYASLARDPDAAPRSPVPARDRILALADSLARGADHHPYRIVMGGRDADFAWGSNGVAANQGFVLVQAYRLSGDARYLELALANLEYLLGRNATGFSYVTGVGRRTPRSPHHRPSVAGAVADPVPGLLVGGPNPRAPSQDRCPGYASGEPAEVYIDDACSYASNEVAINWNAPLVYLASALEALAVTAGFAGGS